ncbi:MAG TPA: GntR family transcriptional regulator [Streptosporangiaceae bacterium]|nr:GntR family transcriptional regulator [Streptosporangiaceae bacterium]
MPSAPITHQITNDLRRRISDGTYGPGALLPSEPELAQRYGVSRQTARAALKALEQEGLIVVHSTRGRTVRNRPPLRRVSSIRRHASHRDSGKPEFDTEAVEQGQVPSRQMLMVGRGPVPKDVAVWLGSEAGQEAVIRKRLQLLNGEPAVISTSYYPLWVAEGTRLESPDALPEGPDNLIEQLGHRFARGMELLQARMPTPDEVTMLELAPGVPVVRMFHIDYDAEGRTLQVADDLYAADRHEFAFEWSEPDGAPLND